MSYIGKEPIVGNFQVCDAISVVNGQASYTMQVSSVNVTPESANHMLVSLNGILQKPNSSFTISGSTITFASNLATGDVIDFIMLLGNVLDIGIPSDSSVTDAKANFVSTSSGAGLQIKGDGTTDGTLQLNCSQNSHGIKLASPAHSAGQSYTLKFPTGNVTAGKVLKVDSISGSGTTAVGQLSFGSAGGLVLLHQASSSVDVANLDIDSTYINSTYDNYLIKLNLIPATNAVNIYGRMFVGGVVQTGGSAYAYANYALDSNTTGASGGQNASNTNDYFTLISMDTIGNSSTDTFQSVLELANVNSTTFQTSLHSSSHFMNGDSTAIPYSLKGVAHFRDNSAVINGIRFYFSSGNISEYEYKIYGIVKT